MNQGKLPQNKQVTSSESEPIPSTTPLIPSNNWYKPLVTSLVILIFLIAIWLLRTNTRQSTSTSLTKKTTPTNTVSDSQIRIFEDKQIENMKFTYHTGKWELSQLKIQPYSLTQIELKDKKGKGKLTLRYSPDGLGMGGWAKTFKRKEIHNVGEKLVRWTNIGANGSVGFNYGLTGPINLEGSVESYPAIIFFDASPKEYEFFISSCKEQNAGEVGLRLPGFVSKEECADVVNGDAIGYIEVPTFIRSIRLKYLAPLKDILGKEDIQGFTDTGSISLEVGYEGNNPEDAEEIIKQIVEPSANQTTSNWKTYTSIAGGFSIKHPPEVITSEPEDLTNERDGYVTFMQRGPTQVDQTEFYDALLIMIKPGFLNGQTLSDYVNNEVKNSKQLGEILEYPKPVTIAGVSGLQYKSSGLGSSTYYYLPIKDKEFLHIIDATNDPTNKGFKKTVEQMLSTLQITN